MRSESNLKRANTHLFAILSLAACWGGGVHAQDNADKPRADLTEVVVTGTRIHVTGDSQPTPTTIVSTEQLQATTATSVQDAVLKLPQFALSSATPNSSIASNGAGYNQPGDFLDLRGMGSQYTLILQDGNRVPSTFFDSRVDTNMLPQLLMKRVDVVTGGVSAVYGSDAVAGVVNFITDTTFNGVKGVVQGGISNYGDAGSSKVGLAFGTPVFERGHFEGSYEYYDRLPVTNTADRPLGRTGATVVGAGTTASPFTTVNNVNQSNVSSGGLVMTGPFAGQQFLPNGSLAAFNPGTPTGTTNLAVGGDGSRAENQYLLFHHKTQQGFLRYDYELTDDIHLYAQGRRTENYDFGANQIYTNVSNASPTNPTDAGGSYPIWIYSGNAFLSPAQQAALTNSGTASFAVNRMDNDMMKDLSFTQKLSASAFTVGGNGKLGFGDLAWDVHYTYGDNTNTYTTNNNVNAAKFYAAIDAVVDPSTGRTVCHVSLTAPGAFPGCVPLNIFGSGNASQAALNYVFDNTSYKATNSLGDAGGNVTGTLFRDWAGPVQFAAGLQYRKETMRMSPNVTDNSFNPQYLRLGPDGDSLPTSYPGSNLGYFKEVPGGANGDQEVFEKNVELNVPLLKDAPFARDLGINAAYRNATYRVSGDQTYSSKFSSNTWKIGAEWTILDGLKLRATHSRDFHAPTLWNLYQAQFISAAGRTDSLTNTAGSVNTVSGGNPNLKPEIGKDETFGVIYQPAFLRNFSIAVDYFRMDLTNAIASISGFDPQAQALCQASNGSSPYCALLVRPISYNNTSPANFPTLVYANLQNTAVEKSRGFDVEVNYDVPLPGASDLAMRLFWSHQSVLSSTAYPTEPAVNVAGSIVAGPAALPKDKVNLNLAYRLGGFGFDVLQRFISKTNVDVASSGFVYTSPTVPAYYQTDVNLAYDWNVGSGMVTTFLNVNNLFNTDGGVYQSHWWSGSPGLRYPAVDYADIVGRYFNLGVRFKF